MTGAGYTVAQEASETKPWSVPTVSGHPYAQTPCSEGDGVGGSASAVLQTEVGAPNDSRTPGTCSTDAVSMVDALQRLAELRGAGMLTEVEYTAAKQRVLSS